MSVGGESPPFASPSRSSVAILAAVTCLLAAFCFFVIPVWSTFDKTLLGSAVFRHDAVLNAGILEWGYRSLWSAHLHFFDWPAGFPLTNALAGTENLVGWQLFYSLMRAGGVSVAGSYNVTLLASLVISGVGSSLLAMRYGASLFGSIISGFVFAFSAFHIDHMVHLQTMATCWSPFALLGLDVALERRSLPALVLLGASFTMTMLCGIYFGVFLSIVIVAYAVIAWIVQLHRFSAKRLIELATTGVVCVALVSPVLIHYFDFASAYGAYPHSGHELSNSSLPVSSLIQAPQWLALWGKSAIATSDPGRFGNAFSGVGVLVLVLCGCVAGRGSANHRAIATLAILALLCFLLALGPTVELHSSEPIAFLSSLPLPRKLWLTISAVRWPMRIFMYSVLCAAVISGLGATWMMGMIAHRWRIPVGFLAMALIVAELTPSPSFSRLSATISDPVRMSDAYSFLLRESDRGGIAELPSRMDSGIATPYAARYAYASAGHLRRVVAFHGSLFPPLLDSLRQATYELPAMNAFALMRNSGVTRIVIHKDLMSADSSAFLIDALRHDGATIVFESRQSAVLAVMR